VQCGAGASPAHSIHTPPAKPRVPKPESRLSREAAKEYSPRRKPWVTAYKKASPEGAKETYP